MPVGHEIRWDSSHYWQCAKAMHARSREVHPVGRTGPVPPPRPKCTTVVVMVLGDRQPARRVEVAVQRARDRLAAALAAVSGPQKRPYARIALSRAMRVLRPNSQVLCSDSCFAFDTRISFILRNASDKRRHKPQPSIRLDPRHGRAGYLPCGKYRIL